MTILAPQANIVTAASLPWRHTTPLHRKLGARVLRFPLPAIAANAPFTVFQGQFTAAEIDRIIGCYIGLGALAVPGSFTLSEQSTGFNFSLKAAGLLGNYWFNIETPNNSANITFTPSINIAANSGAMINLYNFEIQPAIMGHS